MNTKKRTKYVYSNSAEVAHIWASQSQDSARVGGRRNCYFSGTSIYSYGKHYETGRLLTIKGKQVALINRTGYSHTTGKHINEAASATSDMLQVTVDHSFDWQAGLVKMQGKLVDQLFNTLNGRSFWSEEKIKGDAEYGLLADINQFNTVATALGEKHLVLNVGEDTWQLLQSHIDARIARQRELNALKMSPEYLERQAKKRAAEEKRKLASLTDKIRTWQAGGAYQQELSTLKPQLIRVKDDVVETTGRASVPAQDAVKLIKAIVKGKAKPGTKIGHYTFNQYDKNTNTVKIGCHTINIEHAVSVLNSLRVS